MQMPRHNVPHYTGNGIWDGKVLSLPEAIAAMLSDPFAYGSSPMFAAYKALFQGLEGEHIVRVLRARWVTTIMPFDDTHNEVANHFFSRAHGITRAQITRSKLWAHVPSAVRRTIEDARFALDEGAATCASAALPTMINHIK